MLRNWRLLLLTLSCLFTACSSTPPETDVVVEAKVLPLRPYYSEAHLDFAKKGRTPDSFIAKGKEFAISSAGYYSSKAGEETFKNGGNLVDAAVAASFALAVERPQSLGLGGGGFMLLHLKEESPNDTFVDFRETAPHLAKKNMFLDAKGQVIPKLSTQGGLAVATPGFVAGLYEIHSRWGLLPWKQVLEPAIRLARNGFPIAPDLAKALEKNKETLFKEAYLKTIFANKNGELLKAGDSLVQEDLAKTLEQIAAHGRAIFYTGKIGHEIVRFLHAQKGILDDKDLAKYEIKIRPPVVGKYGDYTFTSAPPPSAGGVMLAEILGVLARFDLNKEATDPVRYSMLLAEVMKRSYADRSENIGDPDYYKHDPKFLYSREHTRKIYDGIDFGKPTPSVKISPAKPGKEDHGTGQLSLMDHEGNAISATLTVNDSFGAMIAAPGTGFLLNNEMDDFSVKPGEPNSYGLTGSEANSIAPGKRPVSSMMPTIVSLGTDPVLVIGAAGGSRIISSCLQTILNVLHVYPWDLRAAVFGPRVHHQWLPDKLDLESSISETTRSELERLGYKIDKWDWNAIVQATEKNSDGDFIAVSDPRGEGGAFAQ